MGGERDLAKHQPVRVKRFHQFSPDKKAPPLFWSEPCMSGIKGQLSGGLLTS